MPRAVLRLPARTPRRGKYNAVRTVVDGVAFASKREAARYAALRALERAGAITDLRLQVRYPLWVDDVRVAVYVADFVYRRAGRTVVEDVKGVRTPVYRLKAKLLRAIYGVVISEV